MSYAQQKHERWKKRLTQTLRPLVESGVFRAKRKPSPRKLEPHEVIAKLKARTTDRARVQA